MSASVPSPGPVCPYCALPNPAKLKIPKSPFSSLLRVNYPSIDSHKTRKIEKYVSQVKRQLTLLERKAKLLRVIIDDHKALLGPVRRMPPEVWGLVFRWCVDFEAVEGVKAVPIQWTLSQVCRFWREVALSSSQLWSRMQVASPKDVLRIPTSIKRSSSQPLSLDLTTGNQSSYTDAEVAQFLTQHSGRWENIAVRTQTDYSEPNALGHPSLAETSFPTLRVFQWTMRGDPAMRGKRAYIKQVSLLENATRLDSVVLDDVPAAHKLRLPWAQLSSLSLTYGEMDGNTLLRILSLTPSLTQCTLDFNALTSPSQSDPVSLPSLISLSVLRSFTFVQTVIPFLLMPLLQDLVVTELSSVASLILLIRTSQCTIKRLTLHSALLANHELAPLLAEMPMLVHLSIEWAGLCMIMPHAGHITDEVLLGLTYNKGAAHFPLKALEHLELKRLCDMSMELFVTMVESRCDGVGEEAMQLKSLFLSFAMTQEKKDIRTRHLRRLYALKKAGLSLTIPTPNKPSTP